MWPGCAATRGSASLAQREMRPTAALQGSPAASWGGGFGHRGETILTSQATLRETGDCRSRKGEGAGRPSSQVADAFRRGKTKNRPVVGKEKKKKPKPTVVGKEKRGQGSLARGRRKRSTEKTQPALSGEGKPSAPTREGRRVGRVRGGHGDV